MSPVSDQIEQIADLFMGAAHADSGPSGAERTYIQKQLADLLSVEALPSALLTHLERFDPAHFDAEATARNLKASPPMRLRRLLELVAFVTVADGVLAPPEDDYIRMLGMAFGLREEEYRDLTLAHESRGPRRTFTKMAVVKLPDPKAP